MALAVKNVSETMLHSMLWMSGFLRARLSQMDDTYDWMGQCNPRAPARLGMARYVPALGRALARAFPAP